MIKDNDQRQNMWLEISARTFNFARYARQKFENGTLRQKRDIFGALGSNLVIRDKKLNVEALEPILILKKGLASIPQARATLEPTILRSNKGQRASFNALNPHWLAWRGELRTLNWVEMFPYPSVSLQQMRQLLAVVQ